MRIVRIAGVAAVLLLAGSARSWADPTYKCVNNDCGSVCDCTTPNGCSCATHSSRGGSSSENSRPLKVSIGNKASNYTLEPHGSSTRSRRERWTVPTKYTSYRDATRALAAEKWSDAIRGFRDVLSYDRGDATAYKGLGWALFKSGKPAEAVAELRAAVKLAPGDSQAKELLADALAANGALLLAAGDVDGADAAFREAAQLGDASAKENLRRVDDYRAALAARAKSEQILAAAGHDAAIGAQHGERVVAATADETASEEARRPFDTAGELVPPVRVEPLSAIPANLGSTSATPPAIPPIPAERAAATKPLLERRAAAETRRIAADAQIAALTALPASPERDAGVAKARDASSRAASERVFLDLAIAGTIRVSPAPPAAVRDCRDADARVARLDLGIASQQTALTRTKTIIDQAASDDVAARAAARERVFSAAKDELSSVAGDLLSSTRALRLKTKALRAAGLDRADRRGALEAVKALEDGLDAMEGAWSGAETAAKLLTQAPEIRAKADALVHDTRSLEEKLAVLRTALVDAGLADQAGEFLASKLAGPLGALAFRAARLALDVGVLAGEASISAELHARAEADYAILLREHQRVIQMRDSLRACSAH